MKNNVLLLFAAVVTSLVSLIGVALIESSVGLHTLVRAGDIDLVLLSVVVGFLLTYFVMSRGDNLELSTRSHFKNCWLLYLVVFLAITYAELSDSLFQARILSAYVVTFVVAIIAVIVTQLLMTIFRKQNFIQ
jgi:cytochrome bd-type quinol oxidase subunit 2